MIKKIFQDSFFYTLSNIFTKGVAFLMLPIYLAYLTKEDFGMFDYILIIGSLFNIVITLEISQSVLRFASELKKDRILKSRFIGSAVLFVCSSYFLVFVFLLIFIDDISIFIDVENNTDQVLLLIFLMFFSTSLIGLTITIYKSDLNTKMATISAAMSAFLLALSTYIFLYFLNLGLIGALLGIIVGQLIVALANLYHLRKFWMVLPDFSVVKTMLSFSSPLVLSSVAVFFILFSDRLFINEMLTASDLSEYSLAARIASGLTIVVYAIDSAMTPLVYSRIKSYKTTLAIKYFMIRYFLFGLVLLIFAYFFSHNLIDLITDKDFSESANLFVYLLLSILIFNGYIFFPGLSIKKKTHIIASINISTGALNICLNYLLIPEFEVYGAIYATLISSIVYLLLNIYFSEKHYPILRRHKI